MQITMPPASMEFTGDKSVRPLLYRCRDEDGYTRLAEEN
jgi:hypothetical protein